MVSTGEMGIYFWTGRMPTVLAAFPTPQALKDYLCDRDAPLFIMYQMPTDLYGMSRDAAVEDLELARQFNDGEMYVCPANH
jgi:CubicO group peptidase (beta-lactamase class C family)